MRPAVALLALALLAPLADAATDVHVGLVSAKSLGCSPDVFTSPDLRVRVYVKDALVLQTREASDQKEPLFANLTTARADPPVRISVEVEEGEPSGFLGTGTRYVACGLAPGGAVRHTFTWDGGQTRAVTIRGDTSNAAEVTVVVGTDAPAPPAVRVSNVSSGSADLSWDATPADVRHRLAFGGEGRVIEPMAAGATSHRVRDLCDGETYAFRVVRDHGPWQVGSRDVVVETLNAPPPSPAILGIERGNDTALVRWTGLPHDARSLDVHAGNGSFAPTASNLVDTLTFVEGAPVGASGSRAVPLPPDRTHVRLVVTDRGGLRATSEPVAVAAAPRTDEPPAPSCTLPLAIPPVPANPSPDIVTTTPGVTVGARTEGGDVGPALPVWGWALVAFLAGGLVVALVLRRKS